MRTDTNTLNASAPQITITPFDISPEALLALLRKQFPPVIPNEIETPEQMQEAARLLGECMANYVYLENMHVEARLIKRRLKQSKAPKEEIEEALIREEILDSWSDMAKNSYSAISRMISTRQQVLFELRMTDGIPAGRPGAGGTKN